MRLYLDGDPIQVETPGLATALREGAARAEQRGRIVVEATLDGRALSDEQLEHPSDDPGAGDEVRLLSAEPKSLVRITLLDAADALEDAKVRQAQCARQLQTGDMEGAMQTLSDAITVWQAVRDVVSRSADLLQLPLDGMTFPGPDADSPPVGQLVASLTANLEELKRSVNAEDWSALADVLAYDLDEQADRWRGLMHNLAEHVKSMP
jgi:hypothetical protein